MIEVLALPGWNVPRTTLDDWTGRFDGLGLVAAVTRESTGVSWIEVEAVQLRGYAMMEGRHVEAINFELNGEDPGPARDALARVSEALGWELSEDDDLEIDDVEED